MKKSVAERFWDKSIRNRRSYRGEGNPKVNLTEELVREIRRSDKSLMTWARELGLSKPTIQRARAGINWSHVK